MGSTIGCACCQKENQAIPHDEESTIAADSVFLKRLSQEEIEADNPNLNLNLNMEEVKYQTFEISGKTFEFPDFLTSQYQVNNLLGKGGFGSVFEVKSKSTEEAHALKRLEFTDAKKFKDFIKEINILYRLMGFSNIVQFLENYNDVKKNVIYILMEKGDQSLEDLLKTKPEGLNPDLARQLLVEMVLALSSAYNEGVAHFDIKPGNILIFTNERSISLEVSPKIPQKQQIIFKLGDFGGGTIKIMHEETQLRKGMGYTEKFASPEVIRFVKGDSDEYICFEKADVYALGQTILMSCGVRNVEKIIYHEKKHDNEINEALEKLKPRFDETFIEILGKMLAFDKNKRINFSDLLKILNVGLPKASFHEKRKKKVIRSIRPEQNAPSRKVASQCQKHLDFSFYFDLIKEAGKKLTIKKKQMRCFLQPNSFLIRLLMIRGKLQFNYIKNFSAFFNDFYSIFTIIDIETKYKDIPFLTLKYDLSKEIYRGFVIEGLREIAGIQIWPDKSFYFGQFRRDELSDIGFKLFADGKAFFGLWKNGLMHFGSLLIDKDLLYIGRFKSDLADGVGVEWKVEGSVYVGNFSKGKKHGLGMLKDPMNNLKLMEYDLDKIEKEEIWNEKEHKIPFEEEFFENPDELPSFWSVAPHNSKKENTFFQRIRDQLIQSKIL